MKFNAFIFDLDGTLLDTMPDLVFLTNRILREVGAPEHTQEEILGYIGAGVRRLIYMALPPDASPEQTERAMELWNEHFAEYHEHTVPYEGIVELLAELRHRGCALGVVSNKLQSGVDVVMDAKLPGAVDVMYGESDVTPRKPDPAGILKAMEALGADPASTLYIGDSPSDAVAAHRAGCRAAAVTWGYRPKSDFENSSDPDAHPDIYVDSALDLLEYCV